MRVLKLLLSFFLLIVAACSAEQAPPAEPERSDTVRAVVQVRPGQAPEEVEMEVHPVPVDPPAREVGEVDLADDELVLGIVAGGQAMAYPVRYLALHEVVDDRVGDTPVAPSW